MDINKKVELPTDEHGFIGRECPECDRYFKVKVGTGLNTSICHCPYCGYTAEYGAFITKDQIEYAKNIAVREAGELLIEPELRRLEQSFKELEKSTNGGFIQIKVNIPHSTIKFPLKYYQEKEVETYVTCDNCGLEFAIYGVFANCPDCGKLNASIIFKKSIEVEHKKICLLSSVQDDPELQEGLLSDALSGGVSSFDGLGKALQSHYPNFFSPKTKNLFQKLEVLSDTLSKSLGKSLYDIIGKENFEFLLKMFQVRHIYEHNSGVVDDDFVSKVLNSEDLKGRKYPLKQDEIEKFLDLILETGNEILKLIEGENEE